MEVMYQGPDIKEIIYLENAWRQHKFKAQINSLRLIFYKIFPCEIIEMFVEEMKFVRDISFIRVSGSCGTQKIKAILKYN